MAAAVPLVEAAASTSPNRMVAVSKHLPSFLPSIISPTPSLYYNFPYFLLLSFPFSFLFSLYNHHYYYHHYYSHYYYYHNYHNYHNGSFRPLLNSLGMGDSDCSPRACSVRAFLVLVSFLGCSVDKESLRVIIC